MVKNRPVYPVDVFVLPSVLARFIYTEPNILDISISASYLAYHVPSKECVGNSARAQCAWDSGSVTALGLDLLTRTQAGTQCPETT